MSRSLTTLWDERVAAAPDAAALAYFDARWSAAEVDRAGDALAAALLDHGVGRGDRVGIYLQNVPAFPITMLALWKIGAAALPLNPMYRGAELRHLVDDARPVAIVCGTELLDQARDALDGSSVRWWVGCDPAAFQTRDDPRVFPLTSGATDDVVELGHLVEEYAGRGVPRVELADDDLALLTYTSGTTGPPKGALNSHGNVAAVALGYAAWLELGPDDVMFGIAPLFHITGAVLNATSALLGGSLLVLGYRFEAGVVLDAFREHGVTTTVGSITAFNALAERAGDDASAFATMRALYSGGAPIPPVTVQRFRERFGVCIHNVYGMTETSAAVIAVPLGEEAPVDPTSGSLSVGKALPTLSVRVLGPDGEPVGPGEQGELELCGPQVVSGYWERPEATAATMPDGRLRTGDVAVVDEDGWIYLVDRLKDQINVSGYKVWPREVEDALVAHPDVLEAAVVGRPDDYQGESVVAHVALAAGGAATPQELIAFVGDRLAAYKRPREVLIVEDLPKTQTGKIMRAALRGQR